MDNFERIKKDFDISKCQFYNIDLANDLSSISDKYDIILASNIINWIDSCKISNFSDNMYELLNNNGSLVLTNVTRNISFREQNILKSNFYIERLPYASTMGGEMPLGNVLIKR